MIAATGKLTNGLTYLRENGIGQLFRETLYRATNALRDRWHNVDTGGVMLDGLEKEEWFGYTAIGYSALRTTLRRLPMLPEDISFIDIGSGKARPGIVAAALGCGRVRGVEIVESLHRIAEANFAGMRFRRTKDVECIQDDATTYVIPADVNVVYIGNAFSGETLERVAQNIHASWLAAPRPMWLIYFNAVHFEKLRAERGYDWLTLVSGDLVYPRFSRYIYHLKAENGSPRSGR